MEDKKTPVREMHLGKTAKRLIGSMFRSYPLRSGLTVLFILVGTAASTLNMVYIQKVISLCESILEGGMGWEAAKPLAAKYTIELGMFYILSIVTTIAWTQMQAVISEGMVKKMRVEMFDRMESLPIRYFDRNAFGDIMSHYTNDIDTIVGLISDCLPQLLAAAVTEIALLVIMFWYSFWLSLVVLAGTAVMVYLTRKLGGKSASYFILQQKTLGAVEGCAQEIMNGQKVVKVFCHEKEAEEQFGRFNEELYRDAKKANDYGNVLGPVLNNIGNLLYVLVAFAGGLFLTFGVKNVSVSGLALDISIAVTFLNITRRFAGNIGQVSHQVNAVVLGLAGAKRVFELTDEQPEVDDGYVTLVNVTKAADGSLAECEQQTGSWAWKHPHSADGSVTYTPLMGDVRLQDVDFGYDPGKPVLHDISLYAEPGQKVAFVGATGAGKTTITNLLNRFYDIEDGKIRYDGININKIRKADLRHSLGMVLQDTSLFSGTVMDNIRYGRPDAKDEECINAAKLAGADGFITRLPHGYETLLSGNGANLSQGQRQLLSIARAAVADPPVMILDEATSSIDTRTEAIVQRGMDALMKGRTVFVIAHRLSTVKNADVIMVLDHGRIIERGSHDELIAAKGMYYSLYTGAFELE